MCRTSIFYEYECRWRHGIEMYTLSDDIGKRVDSTGASVSSRYYNRLIFFFCKKIETDFFCEKTKPTFFAKPTMADRRRVDRDECRLIFVRRTTFRRCRCWKNVDENRIEDAGRTKTRCGVWRQRRCAVTRNTRVASSSTVVKLRWPY